MADIVPTGINPTTGEPKSAQPGDVLKAVDGSDLIPGIFTPAYYFGWYNGSRVGDRRLLYNQEVVSQGISQSGVTGYFTVTAAGFYVILVTGFAGGVSVTDLWLQSPGGSTPPNNLVAKGTGGPGGVGQDGFPITAIKQLAASGTFEVYRSSDYPPLGNKNNHITVFRIA